MKRCLFFLLAIVLAASPALGIDIQNFNAAIGSNNLASLYISEPLGSGQFCGGVLMNLSGEPLVFTLPNDEELKVVEQMLANQFYAAVGLFNTLDLGLSASYNQVSGSDLDIAVAEGFPTGNDTSYVGTGDLRATVKVRVLKNKKGSVGLAVLPFGHFSIGDEDYYMGAGATDFGVLGIVDKRFDRVNIILNAGYKVKGKADEIEPSNEMMGGAGVNLYLHRYVDAFGEIYGKTVDYNIEYIDPEVPVEILGGVKLYSGYRLCFTLAGGGGITSGIGSPTYRVVAGFALTMPELDRTPPESDKTTAPFALDSTTEDTDRDGLTNWQESMTYNTDPLKPDTDGDGLTDGEEIAIHKTDPLRIDTDEDGLNDGAEVKIHGTDPTRVDSDNDTLPDGMEVDEVRTNPLSPDTDDDGVFDNADGAPLEPETVNGFMDEDGIPEVTLAKRPSGVIMFENQIALPAGLVWTGPNKDAPDAGSGKLLDDVAAMLKDYPSIRLEIEGHVAEGGFEEDNKILTQARADAVRDHLIGTGVSADRLTAMGQGSAYPIASNQTEQERARNNRVEFIIVGR